MSIKLRGFGVPFLLFFLIGCSQSENERMKDVDVKSEILTDKDGDKYILKTYSQGQVKIPVVYVGGGNVNRNYAVTFMGFYWPTLAPRKKPQESGVESLVEFFFIFNARGGMFKNVKNITPAVLVLKEENKYQSVTRKKHFTVYEHIGGEGEFGIVDTEFATDPVGNQITYSCAYDLGKCYSSWVINPSLSVRIKFHPFYIDDKAAALQEISRLVQEFIKE